MQRQQLIDVAHGLGRSIADQALWQGEQCTWEVQTLDQATGGPSPEVAGGGLYQGSGGIALFLAELYGVTGDDRMATTAAGGLRHALADAAELPAASFSFHGGRVGAAYLAVRLAELLAKPRYVQRAEELLRPLVGKGEKDHGLDVIGGAAGAIPALLWLRSRVDDRKLSEDLLQTSIDLGSRLINAARREPEGWSWNTVGPAATRHVAGFAHGAAGGALALLELAHATGQGRFRLAAEMAFLYERQIFDPEQSNWPDLRHREMNLIYYSADRDSLRSRDTADSLPPYEPRFMTAWCHGSPGIGLSRIRAYELTGQEIYRQEAEAALRSTLASLEHLEGQGFSLCHGVAGNCELPLYAAEVLERPELREVALRCAEMGARTYGDGERPWPCGTVEQAPDPSLLLGHAGMGYFYLRLASPELPTPLILRPAVAAVAQVTVEISVDEATDNGATSYAAQRREAVREYFGQTLDAWQRLEVPWTLPPCLGDGGHTTPRQQGPASEAYAALKQALESTSPELRPLAEDAFRLERRRFELAAQPNDLSLCFLRNLRRTPSDDVPWHTAGFLPSEDCMLVTTAWDWDGPWETADTQSRPAPREQAWVIARPAERLVTRPLAPLAAAMLASLGMPTEDHGQRDPSSAVRLHDLVESLLRALGGAPDPEQRRGLTAQIEHQLRELYRVGLVDTVPVTVSDETVRSQLAEA